MSSPNDANRRNVVVRWYGFMKQVDMNSVYTQ